MPTSSGVWVSNQFDGTVVRIDPMTNEVVRRIAVGNRPQGVAIAGGDLLVGVRGSDAAHRGGTLTVRNDARSRLDRHRRSRTARPPGRILRMTNDGLVAFNQVAGVGGTQLVPDLAVSLPTPTDGGRTYTFQLRPGIRYSTGRPVKASDVRSTLERAFRIGLAGAVLRRHRRRRRLPADPAALRPLARDRHGRRRGDGRRSTSSRRTRSSCTSWPSRPRTSLPAGTPARDTGTHPLPATGPYVIATYRPNRVLRLERNPYFHEWSKAAQPDGYPDTIVLKLGGTADEAIDDVIRGKADLMSTLSSGTPSPSRLGGSQDAICEPGPHEPGAADREPLPQHASRAVRPSRRAAGGQLRRGSLRGDPDAGRPDPRRGDVPDAPSALSGLPSLLPVHGTSDVQRHVDRARPEAGHERSSRAPAHAA